MNAQEALEIIRYEVDEEGHCGYIENELQVAMTALDKQIPKKPQKSESGMFYICPTCSKFINRREKSHGNIDIPHCKWCGQALEWSDKK